MKKKHTTKKKANRSFDIKYTGYMNERVRKESNKHFLTKEKEPGRFTKAKPIRKPTKK